jgi:hypothetical protein
MMDIEFEGHSFSIEIIAPKGLIDLDKALAESGLGLYIYHSQFSGKNILKSQSSVIELGMDAGSSDLMYGSGFIYADFDSSIAMMQTLSDIFKRYDYPHTITLDDESNDVTVSFNFDYSG